MFRRAEPSYPAEMWLLERKWGIRPTEFVSKGPFRRILVAHRIDERFGVRTPVFNRAKQLTSRMNDLMNKESAIVSQNQRARSKSGPRFFYFFTFFTLPANNSHVPLRLALLPAAT